ncbi:hypothetical protein [Aliarcobacter cryaerophilus]|uniref:hypothetical protein n=1 Tax=Aliarcobacter cryaerophilus TaxID=28198 RepID=UPI0008252C1C|nr:hypothetical protein [Aliarcobacter cryaerophilus]
MGLKRIEQNTVFKLTQNIRKYTYEIEQYLKIKFKENNSQILPVPPIPDELEPDIARFAIQFNINNTNLVGFEISQLRVSFYFQALNDSFLTKSDIERFIEDVTDLKSNLKTIVDNFFVLYEGIVVTNEKITKNIEDITLCDFTEEDDEVRNRNARALDNKHFINTDKVVFKVFNSTSHIQSLAKNLDLIGFNETYIKEINNKKFYNSEKEIIENELIINNIKDKLLEDIIL